GNFYLSLGATALLLPAVLHSVRVRSGRADRHLGNLAYAVYLFHFIPKVMMDNSAFASRLNRPVWLIVYWSAAALGAGLIYVLIDRKSEVLRHRFVSSRVQS